VKKREYIVCGFVCDEAAGLPNEAVAPGTRWNDIRDGLECPECDVAKVDFEIVERRA
jgi:rubredoxin